MNSPPPPPPPLRSISIPSPRRQVAGGSVQSPSRTVGKRTPTRNSSCGARASGSPSTCGNIGKSRAPTRHRSCGGTPEHQDGRVSRRNRSTNRHRKGSTNNTKSRNIKNASSPLTPTSHRPTIKADRKNRLFEHRKGPVSEAINGSRTPTMDPSIESPNNGIATPIQSPVRPLGRKQSLTPSMASLPPPKSPFRVTLRRKCSKGPLQKKKSKSLVLRDDDEEELSPTERQSPLHRFLQRRQ